MDYMRRQNYKACKWHFVILSNLTLKLIKELQEVFIKVIIKIQKPTYFFLSYLIGRSASPKIASSSI